MTVGFALEYSLGHATHADNLKRFVAGGGGRGIRSVFVDLPYENTPAGILGKLPGVRSNWSLRASCAAYLGLKQQRGKLDAALFHTQVTSLLSAGLMRRLPSVISLDATPIQYDGMGAQYGHAAGGNVTVEQLKKRVNVRAFRAARHLVTWSQWTKDSLVSDYAVAAERITVIPPGIDLEHWRPVSRSALQGAPLNLLFVGGDFARKGGDTLLLALTQHLPASPPVHLHVVTRTPDLPSLPNVTYHTGLTPNSETLQRLYATADVFVFPTRADCLPLAVLEAMAMALPVITTDVGALSEAVGNGEAGLVIPPDDPAALAQAILCLAREPQLRIELSRRARQIAEERFDGAKNYARLLAVVAESAQEKARTR